MARQGFAAQQGARRRVEERRGPHFDEADRQRKVRRQAEVQYPRRSQRRVPMLAERNLTVFQGMLHAIWTDERISASCVSMRNTDHQRENADAARRFEPLKTADIHQLRDAILAQGPTLCADCDGRCMVAAGTQAELGNITRFLTYHQGLRRPGARSSRIRQAVRRSPRLVGGRSRGGSPGVPQPAQFRPASARSREASRLRSSYDPTQPRHRDRPS